MIEYILSSVVTAILSGLLIAMIYMIRSHITIPKGPYTGISNFCIFSLFMIIILAFFLGLAYISPTALNEEENQEVAEVMRMETPEIEEQLSALLSSYMNKYAMFPLLVVETTIYVALNTLLLYIWYSTGEWDTIVNRFLCLQRIWAMIYLTGCPVDFGLRLFGEITFTFISMENYCACWMMFYKSMFYASMTSQLIIAVIRLICVKYSIEYHNR